MSDTDLRDALEHSLSQSDQYDAAAGALDELIAEYSRLVREQTSVEVALVHAASQRVRVSAGGVFGIQAGLTKESVWRQKSFDDDVENSATQLALIAKADKDYSKLLMRFELSAELGFPITISGPTSYMGNTVATAEDLREVLAEALAHPIVGRKIRALQKSLAKAHA